MKKKLAISLFALVYIIIFKITNFETGDVGSATILIYVGVPLFVLVSIIFFIISFYTFYKEKVKVKSLNFISLIINLISLILIFDVF